MPTIDRIVGEKFCGALGCVLYALYQPQILASSHWQLAVLIFIRSTERTNFSVDYPECPVENLQHNAFIRIVAFSL